MSTNRSIIEMIEAIRKGIEHKVGTGIDSIYMADVISLKPLSIKMNNVTITKNLYINPALLLNASDTGEDIEQPFLTSVEPKEIYEFLKEFHKSRTQVLSVLSPNIIIIASAFLNQGALPLHKGNQLKQSSTISPLN